MERVSTSQLIVKDIQKRIAEKFYNVKDKLPTERQLAEQYGVSRIPVREALKTLSEMGLVETRHGSGTFVREMNAEKALDHMKQYLVMTRHSAVELLLMRKLLETQAAKDAALLRNEAEMLEIARLEEECAREIEQKLLGRPHRIKPADFAFHLAVSKASHNSLFLDFINLMHNSIAIHQTILTSGNENLERIRDSHNELRLAIARQDPAAAGQAMEKHLEHISSVIRDGLQEAEIHGRLGQIPD